MSPRSQFTFGILLLCAGLVVLFGSLFVLMGRTDQYRASERAFRYQLTLLDSGSYDAVWAMTDESCRSNLTDARITMRMASRFINDQGMTWQEAFPVREILLSKDRNSAIIILNTKVPGPVFAYLVRRDGDWKIGCLGGGDGAAPDQ